MYLMELFGIVVTIFLSPICVAQGTDDQRLSNVTVPFNETTQLPPLICWKVPLYEKCPDCYPNEMPFRCFVRGVLPMVLLVAVLLIPVLLCCYYRALRNTIRRYQVSLVQAFRDGTTVQHKRIYGYSEDELYNKDRAEKAFNI